MGYAHLNIFFAWFFGFILSGYLLDAFCPDPGKLVRGRSGDAARRDRGNGAMPAAYAQAHIIWFVFARVGALAFAALMILKRTMRSEATPPEVVDRQP